MRIESQVVDLGGVCGDSVRAYNTGRGVNQRESGMLRVCTRVVARGLVKVVREIWVDSRRATARPGCELLSGLCEIAWLGEEGARESSSIKDRY